MIFAIFLKNSVLFNSFYCLFLFIIKNLRLNNLKTRIAVNAKISVFVICVEAIIYLLLYDLHDCTINCKIYDVTNLVNEQHGVIILNSMQATTIHILTNISQSKDNQRMKFGQLIVYSKGDIFCKNNAENEAEKLASDLFLFF